MKKMTLVWGMAVMLSCAVGAWAQQPMKSKAAISEITVEHTPCYGVCPVYKIILRSDNTATFIGQRFTDRTGTYTGNVWRFDRLAQAVRGHGFTALKDRYASMATDQASVITSVTTGGKRKTVENYGDAGPQSLWELEALIDGVVAQTRWTKVSDKIEYPAAH